MSPFKINYSYKLKILFTPRQAKKTNKTVKERIEKLIQLHQNLHELAKLVQNCIKKYYNQKVFKKPDLKKKIKSTYLLKILKASNLVRN